MDKWEKAHRKNINRYARQIDNIYQSAVREAAAIGTSVHDVNPDKPFSFSDYPITGQRAKKLIDDLSEEMDTIIVNGVDTEWTLANNKNNELCNVVFGDKVKNLSQEQERRYYKNNYAARNAFKTRKTAGLALSDRVWNYSTQFKKEIEMGLDLGLRDGLSAADMTKDLKDYLKYPDKLFRRVRDVHGNLHLSRAAKAFNPGQGVYRSSYKNAMRLARTETNIAYRTSDFVRWQQLDFVVGVEIVTSNNHPEADICDELAGRYPKDFKFSGWHPQCRCHAVSILKTPEEMKADNERIMNGEPLKCESINKVDDVPDNFKRWAEENKERMERAKSLPYFVRDNEQYFSQINITDMASSGVKEAQAFNDIITPKRSALEIAEQRHAARTSEQIDDIKNRWNERKMERYCDNNRLQDFGITDEASFNAKYDSMSSPTLKEWLKAKSDVKSSLFDYTGCNFTDINKMCENPDLSNILKRKFMPKAAKQMKNMEDFISNTPLKQDMLFKRITKFDEIEGVFGKEVAQKIKLNKDNVIGCKGVNKRFSSMSFTQQTEFALSEGCDVEIIYFAPKGTQACYARGFNDITGNPNWRGEKGDFYTSDENEFILNNNYTMRISKFEKVDDKTKIFVDILLRRKR